LALRPDAVHRADFADRRDLQIQSDVENKDDLGHLGPPAGDAWAVRGAGRSAGHPREEVHDCRSGAGLDFQPGAGLGCLSVKGVAAVCRDEPEQRLQVLWCLVHRAGRDVVVLELVAVARRCRKKGSEQPGAMVVRAERLAVRVWDPKALAFAARQERAASQQQAAQGAARREALLALVSVLAGLEHEPAQKAPGPAALRQQEALQQRALERWVPEQVQLQAEP
jgi:hypothetical protein